MDYLLVQLQLDDSIRSRRYSVEILPTTKDKIRNYIKALRECIEKSNLTDAKKDSLLHKLDDLESELEKKRLSVLAVALVALQLMAIPGEMWHSAEITHKLVDQIMANVGQSQVVEHESRRLPATEPPKAIEAPRKGPK